MGGGNGGGGTLKVCTGNNQIAPLTLRTNTLKTSRDRLIEALKEKGLEPFPTIYSKEGIVLKDPPPFPNYPLSKEGLYVIQDEASQLVTAILDPKPGRKSLMPVLHLGARRPTWLREWGTKERSLRWT